MKVLLIGKTLSTGGTSRYTNNLIQNLRNRQELSFDFINLRSYYNLPGKFGKRLRLMRDFPRHLDYDNYDLIHYLEYDYSLHGMLRHLKKERKKVILIKTSHGMAKYEDIFRGFLGRYVLKPMLCYSQKYVQDHLDGIIYVSDAQRELFLKEFKLDRAKTHVVYLASSFETYSGSLDRLTKDKEDTILFVGRVERRKRFEKIFELANLMPKVKFEVVGHINDHQYYDELEKIRPRNVEFRIDLSDDELVRAYQKARFFVSFSKWESCPVTYLESISQGTPVIAYSMPIWKMIEKGSGYQVQTPFECASIISRLEKDYPSVVQRTIETAKLFSWERVAEETVSIYKNLISAV